MKLSDDVLIREASGGHVYPGEILWWRWAITPSGAGFDFRNVRSGQCLTFLEGQGTMVATWDNGLAMVGPTSSSNSRRRSRCQ